MISSFKWERKEKFWVEDEQLNKASRESEYYALMIEY